MSRPNYIEYKPDDVKRIATYIFSQIAAGQPVTKVCKEKGLPHLSTFYTWLSDYPELTEAYARAKSDRAACLFDEMEEIEAKVASGEYNPNQGRVLIDSIKWRLGKMNQQYSDNKHTFKVETDLTADLEARLNLAAEKSRKALADLAKSKQIQHQPVDNIQDAEVLKVETDDDE